jgi:DNA-binding NarL/FixJ family response regulator
MPKINLMVFCPDQKMRQALGYLFQETGIFNVLTETGLFEELLATGKNYQPELLLWACSCEKNATANMVSFKKNCPLTKIIYLTGITDIEEINKLPEVLKAGADGCLSLRMLPRDLIKTIEIIALEKYTCLSVYLKSQLDNLFTKLNKNGEKTKDPPEEKQKLTPREKEILHLLAQNYSNLEIAAQLHISEATVKTHVSSILINLKSKNRVQAVAAALNKGIIETL